MAVTMEEYGPKNMSITAIYFHVWLFFQHELHFCMSCKYQRIDWCHVGRVVEINLQDDAL